jgi:hypothetical protein
MEFAKNRMTCITCNGKFKASKFHPYQRTCSKKCSQKAEYEKHKPRYIARAADWKRKNRKKVTKIHRSWRHRNVAKVRMWRRVNMRRRGGRMKSIGDVNSQRFFALCVVQRFRCWWCGKKKSLGMDHIIPVAKNGIHTMSNIVASCSMCNSIKKDRIWPLSIGKLARLQGNKNEDT